MRRSLAFSGTGGLAPSGASRPKLDVTVRGNGRASDRARLRRGTRRTAGRVGTGSFSGFWHRGRARPFDPRTPTPSAPRFAIAPIGRFASAKRASARALSAFAARFRRQAAGFSSASFDARAVRRRAATSTPSAPRHARASTGSPRARARAAFSLRRGATRRHACIPRRVTRRRAMFDDRKPRTRRRACAFACASRAPAAG